MRVLIPLPDRDFDVTGVAVPWRVLRDAGHQVVFATEQAGSLPAADPRLLDRNYLPARWPGDAYLFGRRFRDLLQSGACTALQYGGGRWPGWAGG